MVHTKRGIPPSHSPWCALDPFTTAICTCLGYVPQGISKESGVKCNSKYERDGTGFQVENNRVVHLEGMRRNCVVNTMQECCIPETTNMHGKSSVEGASYYCRQGLDKNETTLPAGCICQVEYAYIYTFALSIAHS